MVKQKSNTQLLIILAGIVAVFIISQAVAFLMLKEGILPMWLSPQIGTFRLHHFVYGNIILVAAGFLAIALRAKINKNILAGMYGIGLGLVLDEFPLWVGYTHELNDTVPFVPMGTWAVFGAIVLIASLLFAGNARSHK